MNNLQQLPAQAMQVGLIHAAPLSVVIEEERRAAEKTQQQPMLSGLSAHIRECWTQARQAKQMTVENRMFQNMRARRGEYDPEKLAAIREMGGSEVFANITSVKCRAAASWLRDVLMSTGSERPWTIRPTPVADLPTDVNDKIVSAAAQGIQQAAQGGQPLTPDQERQLVSDVHDEALQAVQEDARVKADRMADKMEDQLLEGGFLQAMDAFIDDIATFPSAILNGPIVRKRKVLKWLPDKSKPGSFKPQAVDALKLEWERVSPFDIYPSPAATTVDDGYLIHKRKLTREDLNALVGVDGYDDSSIRMVLDDYGQGGLREWLTNDVAQAAAEGKATTQLAQNTDGLIDALQFWGSVQGKMLLDWGLDKKEVPDSTQEYHVEAWLIGSYVVKAVLNYDPLCRKPYYKASYEDIPGSWWGNAVCDLIRDPQVVSNAAARAIVNNMGIASGPQVTVNVERLAPGEDVTQLTPWKIWQVVNDPLGGSAKPVDFFQPDSRIAELMAVFQTFSSMADEYSGLPKYMAGDQAGGAGRTASGLSMLMGNAGKSIKQVVANIDIGVIDPMIERLYNHNMQYADDDALKGDVQIVARGAASLINKETAQLRRTQFLAATMNPVDMQIVGVEGRAAILRESAKSLDMDTDKVVPPLSVLRQKLAAQAMMQQGQQNQGTPAKPDGGSGQTLADGSPTTDNFAPPAGLPNQ